MESAGKSDFVNNVRGRGDKGIVQSDDVPAGEPAVPRPSAWGVRLGEQSVDLFALLIAVVAIAMAWTVRNRAADSERRLAALEDLARAGGLVARLQQVAGPNASAAEPPPLPSQSPTTADAAASEDAQPPEPLRPEPIADAAAPPPPPPSEPTPSFEERFGTQWTVWVGGLALALGGIFLVRYSIEQGLLGPGVRTFLGGLMAAALLAAGEWTRRNEIRAGFAGLPTAHVPSILTAAGTTCAYATVYAAYGLYGFNPAWAGPNIMGRYFRLGAKLDF